MENKKYIGLIQDERDDYSKIGYDISSNLLKMIKWKDEMLKCSNIIKCEIFEIKQYEDKLYIWQNTRIKTENPI